MFHPIDDCEHQLLYLPGTGIASPESAISGSCWQNLAGICNSVWVWWFYMGWFPDVAVSDCPFFCLSSELCLCNSFHGYFVPILRRNKVSTLWSSFFLSFMCFANCTLGILSFWANIHLPVSAYQVTFVIGLPHSG